MAKSFKVVYESTDGTPLLGSRGLMKSESCRFQVRAEAELRMATIKEYNPTCKAEVVETDLYPEIFIHCGIHSQVLGGHCFGCKKLLRIWDAEAAKVIE